MSTILTFTIYVPIMHCGHKFHRQPTDNYYKLHSCYLSALTLPISTLPFASTQLLFQHWLTRSLSGLTYLIKVTSWSLLAMLQTLSQRRAKQLPLFTFSRVTFLITCPRMRRISRVAPADLWLKNCMSESLRSSLWFLEGLQSFYLPPPLSQANIMREILNGLHCPWTGLFVQFPYGIQELFLSSQLLLQICVVVSYHIPKQHCV